MKIIFYSIRKYDKECFNEELKNYPDVKITYLKSELTEDTIKLAENADAICVFVNDEINRNIIQTLSQMGIKLILLRCAGFDNVDLAAAKEYGIQVMRVPGYSPESVAEMAATLMLSVNRKIHKAYNRVRDNDFDLTGLTGMCLYGKTVGIIGYGKIGRCFANICRGFGMNILAYDPYLMKNNIKENNVALVELDELYQKSDIISLHTVLNEKTRNMINKDSISKMKDNVILINVSRGGLVNNDDLIEGIRSGKFFGVGLDVYDGEEANVYKNHENDVLMHSTTARLLSFPNVLVTSHQAFLTDIALSQIAKTTLENAQNYFKNITTKNELVDLSR